MPSPNLGAFGKMLFEKRMREKNMGQDAFGQFKMPTEPGLNEVQRDRLQEIMETTRTEGQPFGNRFREAILGASGIEKGIGSGAMRRVTYLELVLIIVL